MPRIVAVLACFVCMSLRGLGLRKVLKGKSNATMADNGGVDGVGAMSLKSFATLLMVVNAAQLSGHHVVRGLMPSDLRQANLQLAPSPASRHLPSHRSRARPPYMAYDSEEANWTRADDRLLRQFVENIKGPIRGPVRAVLHNKPSPWLLIFNKGKPDEGMYTLEEPPKRYVAAFESEADAERFGTQLHSSDFDYHPTPTKWPVQRLTRFCKMQRFEISYVHDGALVFPPENNNYDMEAFNKAQKGDVSKRASLEHMFMSDPAGDREDVANLERMFMASSHGSQNRREDMANLERRFESSSSGGPGGREEVTNLERRFVPSSRGSQKRKALTRFMRQHRSKIVTGKCEEVLQDLPVGWIVFFHPKGSVIGHPMLSENEWLNPWRRWLPGVPKSSALVFEDREDAKRFVDHLNSEELNRRKAIADVERVRHARWEVQRWETDQIRTFCKTGPFGVALVQKAILGRIYFPSRNSKLSA